MDNRQLFGILGSIVLFLGVFMPIVQLPVLGTLNYFQNGRGDGVIILVLALLALLLVIRRAYRLLWLPGLGSLAVLAFTFVNLQARMTQAKAQIEKELAGNPFRGLADLALQGIQLQWGWAVLVVGSVLLLIAASLRLEPPRSEPGGKVTKSIPEARRKPLQAGLLSLVLPGLGQVYNGQVKKGVLLYCLMQIIPLACLSIIIDLPLALVNIAGPALIVLSLYLYILINAMRTARKLGNTYQRKAYNKWYTYLGALVIAWGVYSPSWLIVCGVGSCRRSKYLLDLWKRRYSLVTIFWSINSCAVLHFPNALTSLCLNIPGRRIENLSSG